MHWVCPSCGFSAEVGSEPARCRCGVISYFDGRVVGQAEVYLGTRIRRVTQAVGIQPCRGCGQREAVINSIDKTARAVYKALRG